MVSDHRLQEKLIGNEKVSTHDTVQKSTFLSFSVFCQRQFGEWLLVGGALSCGLGICTSIVLLNIGMVGMILGGLVCRPPIHRLAGFWLAVGFAAIIFVIDVGVAHDGLKTIPGWSYSWICLYLLPFALAQATARAWFIRMVLIGGFSAVALGLMQFFIGLDDAHPPFRVHASGEHLTRACGWFSHHIRFGSAMCLLLLMSLVPPSVMRLPAPLAWVIFCLGWVGVIISSARGQLLAAIAGAGTYFMARGGRWIALGLGIAVSVGGIGILILAKFAPLRVNAAVSGHDVRWELWGLVGQVIHEHPWLGVGGQGLGPAIRELVARKAVVIQNTWVLDPGHAHNSFLSVAVSYGIPAAILYVSWFLVVMASVWRLGGAARQFGMAVGVAFVIGGLTEDLANLATSRYALFLGLGLALALRGVPGKSKELAPCSAAV